MEKKKNLLNEDDLSKVMGGTNVSLLSLQILNKDAYIHQCMTKDDGYNFSPFEKETIKEKTLDVPGVKAKITAKVRDLKANE